MCDDGGIISGTVLVWKIQLKDSFIISDSIKDIAAIVENDTEELEEGEKAIITRIKMTRKKFEALPEFEGY